MPAPELEAPSIEQMLDNAPKHANLQFQTVYWLKQIAMQLAIANNISAAMLYEFDSEVGHG